MNHFFTPHRTSRLRRIVASVLAVAIGFQLNLAALALTSATARAAEDTTAPTVVIDQPTSGATVSGTVVVAVTASDDTAVTSVQLKLDGAPLGSALTTSPYEYSWDTTSVTNGSYSLTAVAADAAANVATSGIVSVTVDNLAPDTTAPTVLISQPAAATLNGIVVVAVTASDDTAVTSVQLKLDGAPLGSALTTSPYEYSWDTTSVGNGPHALSAAAADAAGNLGTSTPVNVTIDNPDITPPNVAVTAPSNGATVSGSITVTAAATDEAGVASLQFKLNGLLVGEPLTAEPYAYTLNTVALVNGTHGLSAVASDMVGNQGTAPPVTITVDNPDSDPPLVRITDPVGGSGVTGTIPLLAEATDDTGVMSVRFRVNADPLGSPLTRAPYTTTWNTNQLPNGCYALTAVATDRANHATTSDQVLVMVNHTPPPVCAEGQDCTLTSNVANINVGEFQNCTSTSANSGHNNANGHDSPTPTDINTGPATAGADLPSVVNTNITQINGGSGNGLIDIFVSNLNDATLSNSVRTNATTGNNEASGNRYSNISTGDAGVFTSILNAVNTNVVGSTFNSFVQTVADTYYGTIDFMQLMLDLLDTMVQQLGDAYYNLTVNNTSRGTIENNVEINASTGGNVTNNNRYGNINTGDANAAANIVNLLNTNIVGSNWLFSAFNILGDFVGDIILPGEGVVDNFFGDQIANLTVNNNNQAEVINRVNVNGDTGSNDASGNRDGGLVNTGDVHLLTSILNTVNTNIVGANLFSFLPHIFGSWEGQVINGPAADPWQNYHTGDAEGNVKVSNDNDATIHNNLTINAVTGQNNGTGNRTATINTGNINVAANLVNVANTNIVGSNWMFGHFNVFGTWRGNIIYAYPDLAVTNHHEGESLQPGDQLTYTLRYANTGLAPAQQVTLSDTIPEHTVFVSATGGGIFNNNQVVWNLGRVPARTPDRTVSFAVRVVPDLPVGNTVLRNRVNISTLTNEPQQGNNASGSELLVSVASPPTPPVPFTPPVVTPGPSPVTSTSAQPAIQISKTNSAGAGLRPGETVDYNIAVTNTGNVELERILVHDVLPGRNAILFEKDFPLDRLAVGDTMQVSYSLTVSGDTQPGTYTNTATASASYAGSTVGPVSAPSRVEVRPLAPVAPGVAVPPGQSVTKPKVSTPIVLVISQKTNVKGSVKQGGKVNFLVTVLNKGKQALKNIVLVGKLINGSTKKTTWKLGNLSAGKGFRFSFSLNLLPTARAGQYLSQAVATAKTKNGKKITSNTAETKFTVKTVKSKTSTKKVAQPQGRIVRTSVGLRFYDQRHRPISAWAYANLNKQQLVEVLRGSPDPTDRKFISTYQGGLTLVGQRGKNGKLITPTDVLNDLRKIPAFKSIFGSG